jgi:molecular chaperone GrpE
MNEQTSTPENLANEPIQGENTNANDQNGSNEPIAKDNETTANANKDSETANIAKPNYELEIKELKDKYLRLHAEFDTAKRRMARERIEMTQTAGREIITELLPILDDFERAFKAAANVDVKGFELIYHKLKNTLEQKGLNAMKTINQDFDPDLHEAIAQIPAPNDELRDKVVDEVEKGYYIHDKILRYAKVVVGK